MERGIAASARKGEVLRWQQLRMQSSLDRDVIPIMPFSRSESPIHELQACR